MIDTKVVNYTKLLTFKHTNFNLPCYLFIFEPMILFTEQISNRLLYVAGFLESRMQSSFQIVTTRSQIPANEPIINYSKWPIVGSTQIIPVGLLLESDIKVQNLRPGQTDSTPYFFETDRACEIPFDMLSAIFYLLSRYEEYLPFSHDEHGRFTSQSSVLHSISSIEKPIIDIWIARLAEIINQKGANISLQNNYKFLLTCDVDIAYAYRGKGLVRALVFGIKSLIIKKTTLTGFVKALIKKEDDPYNTYSKLLWLNRNNSEKPIFFMHLGNHGPYDKSIRWNHQLMKSLIAELSSNAAIGLHPSMASNKEPELLDTEKQRFMSITNENVQISRQHYLFLRFPDTYRNLIKCGFTHDFSMGYADTIGFRAGTCHDFFFYDLKAEKTTSLRITPLTVMDGTLFSYMKLSQAEATQRVASIVNLVKHYGGTFTLLWHNSSFTALTGSAQWVKVLENIITFATGNDEVFRK